LWSKAEAAQTQMQPIRLWRWVCGAIGANLGLGLQSFQVKPGWAAYAIDRFKTVMMTLIQNTITWSKT